MLPANHQGQIDSTFSRQSCTSGADNSGSADEEYFHAGFVTKYAAICQPVLGSRHCQFVRATDAISPQSLGGIHSVIRRLN